MCEGDVIACTVQLQSTSIAQSVQLLDYRVDDHRNGVQFPAEAIDCSLPHTVRTGYSVGDKTDEASSIPHFRIVLKLIFQRRCTATCHIYVLMVW